MTDNVRQSLGSSGFVAHLLPCPDPFCQCQDLGAVSSSLLRQLNHSHLDLHESQFDRPPYPN